MPLTHKRTMIGHHKVSTEVMMCQEARLHLDSHCLVKYDHMSEEVMKLCPEYKNSY